MELSLLIHNIGYVISITITVALSIVVMFKGQNRRQSILVLLLNISILVFAISHVIGVNIADPRISLQVLRFNLVLPFLSMFLAHAVISIYEKEEQQKWPIRIIYGTGIAVFLFVVLNLDSFLLLPEPKLYFSNYYVAGPIYLLIVIYSLSVVAYLIYQSTKTIIESKRGDNKVFYNRVKYIAFGSLVSSVFGYQAFFLVYDIPVDPIWTWLHVVYVPCHVYAIIHYGMYDIKVVAQKAVMYSLGVGAVTFFVGLISYVNVQLTEMYPQISFWAIPLVSSLGAVTVGHMVWRKVRETDILKYEFMTIVLHKFRTPLTRIKWSVSQLSEAKDDAEREQVANKVKQDTNSLIELTNVLVAMSTDKKPKTLERTEKINISDIVHRLIDERMDIAKAKNITVTSDIADDVFIHGNDNRITFALQVPINNAVAYTPKEGNVQVAVTAKEDNAVITVSDDGIGVSKDEQRYIFDRFFRGNRAKRADTEGFGIGLSVAKQVIESFGGSITFTSEGEGKGTTFTVQLPLAK